MAFKYLDRAKQSVVSAPGVGAITLGGALAGYQTFAQAGANNNDTFSYLIVDGLNWEYGVGTYTSAGINGTLARTVITNTSAQNTSPINASSACHVDAILRAEDVKSTSTLGGLTDVSVNEAILANGDMLAWNTVAALWEGVTPAVSGGAGSGLMFGIAAGLAAVSGASASIVNTVGIATGLASTIHAETLLTPALPVSVATAAGLAAVSGASSTMSNVVGMATGLASTIYAETLLTPALPVSVATAAGLAVVSGASASIVNTVGIAAGLASNIAGSSLVLRPTPRTPVADANYSAFPTDREIVYTSLTATRTVTFPSASTFPAGELLWVIDESGDCSSTININIDFNGSDIGNGANGALPVPLSLNQAFAYVSFESNGINTWTLVNSWQAVAVNVPAGQYYWYAGEYVLSAQVTLNNYFFGPGGNFTMTGDNNFCAGAAFVNNTTGFDNVAVGNYAAYHNTTGNYNCAIGNNALLSNMSGSQNISLGLSSIYYNQTGNYNTGIGFAALQFVGQVQTAGAFVVGVSYTIITAGTTSFTAIGAANNTPGTVFTATGVGSGTGTATPNASNNVCIGFNAGKNIVTGSNNTIIGSYTGSANLTDAVVLATGEGTDRADYNATNALAWTFAAPIVNKTYTVTTLPTSQPVGEQAFATNARVATTSGGALQGSGAGTGALVTYNGTAWQLAGSGITAVA